MSTLKVIVYNKTDVRLKFRAEEIVVGVGADETKIIDFGKLVKEDDQKICVLKGETVVEVLSRHDFPIPNEEKKEFLLAFEMQDGRLQYTFVHWTWEKYRHPKLAVLKRLERYTEKSKTRVDNRTGLQLTFRDVYTTSAAATAGGGQGEAAAVQRAYGLLKLQVGKRNTKIASGKFLQQKKMKKQQAQQEIWVLSGDHLLLVLNSNEFADNHGMDLILDFHQDRIGYAFLQPQQPSWKNWLCFSKVQETEDMSMFA